MYPVWVPGPARPFIDCGTGQVHLLPGFVVILGGGRCCLLPTLWQWQRLVLCLGSGQCLTECLGSGQCLTECTSVIVSDCSASMLWSSTSSKTSMSLAGASHSQLVRPTIDLIDSDPMFPALLLLSSSLPLFLRRMYNSTLCKRGWRPVLCRTESRRFTHTTQGR